MKNIWTNTAYWVDVEYIEDDHIYGVITKSNYRQVYDIGCHVVFPIYNLTDGHQQFFNERELKLERIIDEESIL